MTIPTLPYKRPFSRKKALQRGGLTTLIIGVLATVLGTFPQLVGMDETPGVGLAQLIIILFGLALFTFGGYLVAFSARRRRKHNRLREDIGLRLMATGYVICAVSALADVLGIGTHNLPIVFPYFGPFQLAGMGIGMLTIVVGMILYSQIASPKNVFTGNLPDLEDIP